MEKNQIKDQMDKIEKLLGENPPNGEAALKELNTLSETGVHDPRVLVLRSIALSCTGKRDEALEYAKSALAISKNVSSEAEALIGRLSK